MLTIHNVLHGGSWAFAATYAALRVVIGVYFRAWRRTPIEFDSEDLLLDVTVAPDLSSWAWKDEDELAWSVHAWKYSPAEAAAIRAEGLRVVQALETRAWPFTSDRWAWRPNPPAQLEWAKADWAAESG